MTVLPLRVRRSFLSLKFKGGPRDGKITRGITKKYDEAISKLEQCRHQQQRLENRINDFKEIRRRKRNHRLITCGADVESVAPEVRGMSQTAFRLLVEQIFFLPEVAALVRRATDQQGDR